MFNPYEKEYQILLATMRRATTELSRCRPGKGQTESDIAGAISLTMIAYKKLTGKKLRPRVKK